MNKSVDASLVAFRARVEEDLKSLVDQLIAAAVTARDEAVAAALSAAKEESEQQIKQKVAEAEARAKATIDLLEGARAKERDLVDGDVKAIEAQAEARLEAALASSREELKQVLSSAEDRANQTLRENVISARVQEREAEMAAVSRLLESIRGLDGASSLSEVLDALGRAVAREAARAAVLVLRNDRLLGWKLSGFGARDAQPKAIDLDMAEAGVVGAAVASARPVTTRDGQAADGPGFAQLPADRMGLAVPLIVGGRVVAAVYADGVNDDVQAHVVPSSWPEVIEILTRHAARCLESLSVQKSAGATPRVPAGRGGTPSTAEQAQGSREANTQKRASTEADVSNRAGDQGPFAEEESARRCARLLLLDIKLNHEPAVHEGRRSRNLLSRLGSEIERARRIYDQRVPVTLRTRAELFHQELVATLAGGDPALLGLPA